jgi:hypothetical protein
MVASRRSVVMGDMPCVSCALFWPELFDEVVERDRYGGRMPTEVAIEVEGLLKVPGRGLIWDRSAAPNLIVTWANLSMRKYSFE